MNDNSNQITGRLSLLFVSIIGCALISFSSSTIVHVAIMWSIALIAAKIVNFDLLHPYSWFSALFTLYSTAYAILYSKGLGLYGYSPENILYPTIGLIVVLIIVGPNKNKDRYQPFYSLDTKTINGLIMIFSVLTIFCTFMLVARGYAGKSAMKQASDLFYRVGVYTVRFSTFFTALKLCDSKIEKIIKPGLPIILSIMGCVLFALYTGERDAMFRIIVTVALCLFITGRINNRHLLFLIPIGMIVMISSVVLKYYFSSGSLNSDFLSGGNFVTLFLSTDFSAAGRNLQDLISSNCTHIQSYGLFVTELLNPFFPSGTFFNPDSWYNKDFYVGEYTGRAFTLVGTGYIVDGIYGVIVLFIIVGLIVRLLYKRTYLNVYSMAIYVYMISTIVFSFRQSLSTIPTALIRVALLSVILYKLYNKFQIRS